MQVKLNCLTLSYFDRSSAGDMVSLLSNDLDNVANTLQSGLTSSLSALVLLAVSYTHLDVYKRQDLRCDLFEKIVDWSKETRTGFSNSTLITRTVNDVKQVSNFIDLSLRKIFTLSITVIGALVVSFSLDAKLASIILIVIPAILVIGLLLTTRALPQYSRIRLSIDRINQLFRENIRGIRVDVYKRQLLHCRSSMLFLLIQTLQCLLHLFRLLIKCTLPQ